MVVMDIDFMKPSNAEQMQVMLMQMEKLPDFSGTYSDLNPQIPMMEFTNSNNDIDGNIVMESMQPGFMSIQHPTTTILFSGDPSPEGSFMHPGEGWGADEYSGDGEKRTSMAAMREMIFRIAAMQPVNVDLEAVKPPKRRNVKISTDPQSVAARHRRERISERIRILQRLVPGGTKMDTASMLDEAIHYVKFLKNQVQSLEREAASSLASAGPGVGFPVPMSSGSYFPVVGKGYHHHHHHRHHQSSSQNTQHLADA